MSQALEVLPLDELRAEFRSQHFGGASAAALVTQAVLYVQRRLTQPGEIDVEAVMPVLPDQLASRAVELQPDPK